MIAFKKSKNIFSQIIHLFTNSDVNHVAMFVRLYDRNGLGFPFVIEANDDGVEYNYLPTKLKESKSELYAYKLTDDNLNVINQHLDELYNFANEQIGKEYDAKSAVKSVFDKISEKIVKKDNFKKFFCSELVTALYLESEVINFKTLIKNGFECAAELTPVDCCNLPLFNEVVKLEKDSINAVRTPVHSK